MKRGEKYNIICLSNQLWDFPFWTNKKHVMTRLSKEGHNVIFVDPPIQTGRLFLRQFLKGTWSLMRLLTKTYKDANTIVYSPLDYLPLRGDLAGAHVSKINSLAKKNFSSDRKTLLWVYHVEIPGLDTYINKLRYNFLIYDCVDNYPAFPHYDTAEKKTKISEIESKLSSKADLIFATAPGLVDRLKKYNENTYYTPNVGEYERFKEASNFKKLPSDISSIPKPRIGFTGAVDEYKFDKKLFRQIVKDYPKYSFIIIGPLGLKDREATKREFGFEDADNVYFLGSRPFLKIHKYYAGFDAYMIPYQLNDYTVGGCFPVKFHEALAVGLPVIVTNLPAYRPFEDVSYISRDYNEFSQNIRKALEENSPAKVKERQKIASENTWDKKVATMLKIIKRHLK